VVGCLSERRKVLSSNSCVAKTNKNIHPSKIKKQSQKLKNKAPETIRENYRGST
jgi:hypothetical protein